MTINTAVDHFETIFLMFIYIPPGYKSLRYEPTQNSLGSCTKPGL